MVYSPCLHVTGHIPFASGANINILFRNDLRVPYLETLTTCAPVIYLARAYTARHRLLASGTNILETLAFLLCFCFICQQRHRLRRAAIVLLFAAPFCLPVCASFCSVVFSTLLRVRRGFLQLGDILVSFLFSFHAGSPDISRRLPGPLPSSGVVVFTTYTYRPFCSDFCSVLLSPMFCLRLCFLRLAALLFSSPFSFRDGIPDIGNGACRFFFRFLPGDFRLRCSDPLYCFADASPGNDVIPAVLTDLVTIARTMLCQPTFERERSLLYMAYAASQPAPCLPQTSQAYSAAVACPFPHSGRKTRFVLSSFLSFFLPPSLSLSPSLYRTPQIGGSAAPGR